MSDYGSVPQAGAIRFERLLPARIQRVWAYRTDAELRRQWFAGGAMELRPGGAVTLIFGNSELSHHGEEPPEKYRQYEAGTCTSTYSRTSLRGAPPAPAPSGRPTRATPKNMKPASPPTPADRLIPPAGNSPNGR